jgi:dipicolinate synthase subunit A
MKDKLRFCVMGGDLRQIKLAELLAEDGHSVCTYAMEQASENTQIQNVCTYERVAGADCVVLPLPVITSEGKLNAPFSDAPYCKGQVHDLLNEKQIICAGLVPVCCINRRETRA